MVLKTNDGGKPPTVSPSDYRKDIYPDWWLGWDAIEVPDNYPQKINHV
jgi:hypothetical protein